MHENQNGIKTNPELQALTKKEWHEVANSEINAAIANDEEISVMYLDLDNFKSVNDELGHERGDEVIARVDNLVAVVAGSIRTTQRTDRPRNEMDFVSVPDLKDHKPVFVEAGHIGGDEFAFLFKGGVAVKEKITQRVLENLKNELEKPENKPLRDLGVRLSMGFATLKKGMSAQDLMREADLDMYRNKIGRVPELSIDQQRYLELGLIALEQAGLRPRDIDKYGRKKFHNDIQLMLDYAEPSHAA